MNGWINPLHLVSGYGLFAVMTTNRREIVIEGSYDGVEWREYEFRYKPGDVMRAPLWNIPHQPRLDWQMWFAALDNPQRLRWFWRFPANGCWRTNPTVTALLAKNPVRGQAAASMCARSSTTTPLPAARRRRLANGGTGACSDSISPRCI